MTFFSEKILYTVDPQLPEVVLTAMLDQCKSLTYTDSTVVIKGDGEQGQMKNLRNSQQCWLCWDHWIAGIMHNNFISANNDYFHYDLDHFDSGIQVTKYEPGQKYDWHTDENPVGKPRKLSMSLVLNDDFSGGEFELYRPATRNKELVATKAGSAIIFPSWLVHRVNPVKSGTRYSLVAWMNGPQFK